VRRVLWSLLLCGLVLSPTWAAAQSAVTTVYLVRHAEKAAAPAADPPLTEAGQARAVALQELLATAGVDVVMVTPFARTRATAQPLATALGLTVRELPPPQRVPAHAEQVAALVRAEAGRTVLVVGHSNTIPAIAAALGAPRVPDLCDGEYDQVWVLQLRDGEPTRTVRARFGAPVTDTGCAPMRTGR
jgi:broad specificity phosphatase PhoE